MSELVAMQLVSVPEVSENLRALQIQLEKLQVSTNTLVVLPECFACFGGGDSAMLAVAEVKNSGPIQQALKTLARQYGVWLVAGTLPLKTSDPTKMTASCLLIDDAGQVVDEYQKIHLFDVQVADNTGTYMESRHTHPGNQVVVVDTPFGRLGMAVCYDIRFPGLFQAMGQIDIITLPSAFTQKTGQAHWQALLRARAIENQCYLIAANQGGDHPNGRQTYGHSCIISPWGEIEAEIRYGEGLAQSHLDLARLESIRLSMPVHQHNKFRSHLV
jgi:predicted amidohydrolase